MMEKYRMNTSKGMEFGLYSIGDHVLNPHNGEKISAEQRIHELIKTAQLADEVDLMYLLSVKVIKHTLQRKLIQLF